MGEEAWSFPRAVFVLCLILIPLHLLLDFFMSGSPLSRDLVFVYRVTLLFVGFVTGLKARSHLTALNSILVSAAIVALVFYLLHDGLRIGKVAIVDAFLDIGSPTLGLFFRMYLVPSRGLSFGTCGATA
jgi:hypothetical protein